MSTEPGDLAIDAGAEALRQLEQGGRLLRNWDALPNYDKLKWRKKAQTVLRAATNAEISCLRKALTEIAALHNNDFCTDFSGQMAYIAKRALEQNESK